MSPTVKPHRAPALGALLLAAAMLLGPAAVAQVPVVRTTAGEVQGVAERDVAAFKGIPYARPPVGKLRWRAPESAAKWQGVRTAAANGNACMQLPGLSEANGGYPGVLSEDCLFLNVWTPKADRAAKLPVLVWIHGGAYVFGSGSVAVYNGAPLAKKGAVVVTINYRLGQLGFFAHPALERDEDSPANFGLLDQIAALQWVQQNIAAFGGDPGNVTILGQSAGGKSVLALFASPLARGLFHKGLAMSSYAVPDPPLAKALETGIKVADALGLKGAKTTAAELRAVPAEKFAQLKGQGLSNAPVPVSGDDVLPQPVLDTFAAGKQAPVPLIIGNTSDDSSVIAAFGIDTAELLKRMRGAGFLLKALYPGVKDEAELARQAGRDLVFTTAARLNADRHARQAPTWRYYFDYTAVKDRPKHPNGVAHGSEIAYFLNTGDLFEGTKDIFTDADRDLAARVGDYVLAFARTGTPSAKDGPEWPRHKAGQDRTMLFAETIAVQKNFMRPRLTIMIGAMRVLAALSRRK